MLGNIVPARESWLLMLPMSYLFIGSILIPVTVDDDGSVAGLVQK